MILLRCAVAIFVFKQLRVRRHDLGSLSCLLVMVHTISNGRGKVLKVVCVSFDLAISVGSVVLLSIVALVLLFFIRILIVLIKNHGRVTTIFLVFLVTIGRIRGRLLLLQRTVLHHLHVLLVVVLTVLAEDFFVIVGTIDARLLIIHLGVKLLLHELTVKHLLVE